MATPAETRPLYRFQPYEVDAVRGELRKFGVRIRLERKPWLLLLVLLEHPGELVTRAELQAALWSDGTFVDFEHGLNVAVKKLRAALCDSTENPRYIETVAGEGYRFIAEVEFLPPSRASFSSSETSAHRVDDVSPAAVSAPPSWLQHHKSTLAIAIGLALVLIAIVLPAWRTTPRRQLADSGKVMLVVLPFDNLSGDAGQEYLSDGMTEELSLQLGNLNPQRLGVIGRTSAMTYKQAHKTVGDIGKELAVDYVLEGSVRRDGGELRITAQLVQVSDQTHVWAGNYDRNLRDLLRLESEIAADIARAVGISIARNRSGGSFSARSPNPEAHEAYLLGRYNWNKRTLPAWKAAELYFRRAIQLDPQYALAYAGLAECRIPRSEAAAAALKAVELDPASGEARLALGWVELYKNFDLAAAERALKGAIQLEPNLPSPHHSYGEYLAAVGRLDEAIAEERQAVMLDPLAPRFRGALAELLALAGHDDAANHELQRALEIQPDYPPIHQVMGSIYLRKGRYQEAIRELQISAKEGGDPALGALGYAYARSGRTKDALRILAELRRLEGDSAMLDIVAVEIGLGHKNKALWWLEKSYQAHVNDDGLLFIKVDPMYKPLRSDPRFQDLLRRMNFPS